ncbi:MAG: hypothetical protein ACRC6B_07675, partial [Fusobacteriaceae bacterium]
LFTARSINGTNFNGEANITTANWGTSRTLTIGNTGKAVNGSGNVSWTLAEIGASNSGHTHAYVPLTSPGSTTIVADSDSSSTSEYIEIKAGGNALRVTSSAGGSTPVVANNKLTFNGNIVYNAGQKPTKADVGLPNVKDVSLNWAWGTATPTHIWGAQGDAAQSYVYNGSQLKTFVGLSAVNNWGASAAINSTSATTYATSSAVKQAYDKGVAAESLANTKANRTLTITGTGSLGGGGDLTTNRTITHSTAEGHKHIPAAGSLGQFLKNSAVGTAEWSALPRVTTTADGVIRPLNNLSTTFLDGTGNWQAIKLASSTEAGLIKFSGNVSHYLRGDGAWTNFPELPVVFTDLKDGLVPKRVGQPIGRPEYFLAESGVWKAVTMQTYSVFTRTVSGLVPNPGGSTTTRYLREDGTWVVPPDTKYSVYVGVDAGLVPNGAGVAVGDKPNRYLTASGTWGALPIATTGVLGVVRAGTNVNINSGIISIANYEPAFTKNNAFNKTFGTAAGTVSQGNHTHAYIISEDKRAVNDTPQLAATIPSVNFQFRTNTTDGLADGGTYHGVMTFRPYGTGTDFSGGGVHQLGFTENGNLHIRTSNGASAWKTWSKVLTTA